MNYIRFCFLTCFVPLVGFAQAPKWVVVNFQEVFESFTELQQADQQLKQEIQSYRSEQAAKLEAHNQRKQGFQKMRERAANESLPEAERNTLVQEAAAMFEELRKEEQELQKRQNEFNQQAEAKIVRLRREFADKVSTHIKKMAAEQDWAVVLDSSAVGSNGLPMVQFADSTVDVTVDVIRSLNASVAPAVEEETETEEGE